MPNGKPQYPGANDYIVDILKTYKVPVAAPRMLAEHQKLRTKFKGDTDYVSRALSGMYLSQRIGRAMSTDTEYNGTYAYGVPETPGVTMIPIKGGARKDAAKKAAKKAKKKSRGLTEITAGAALTPRVNGRSHAAAPELPIAHEVHDDDVVIESGNARITMSMGKITIVPRQR